MGRWFMDVGIVEQVHRHQWLRLLLRALDLYDGGETFGHSWRVARGVAAIASRIGWPEATQAVGIRAGLLHDVGKLFVPRTITSKPATLSDAEWEEMRRHPRLGYVLIHDCDPQAAMVLVAHHECARKEIESHSYPRATQRRSTRDRRIVYRVITRDRRGRERRSDDAQWLPLRTVLAVSDTVDALTSNRAYHRARGDAEVRQLLEPRFPEAADAISSLLAMRGDLQEPIPPFLRVALDPRPQAPPYEAAAAP